MLSVLLLGDSQIILVNYKLQKVYLWLSFLDAFIWLNLCNLGFLFLKLLFIMFLGNSFEYIMEGTMENASFWL